MQLLSVNVSKPKHIPYRDEIMVTGIYKTPVNGRVMLHRLNLDGDGQADLKNHGGVDKAVYVYSVENYAFWQRELARDEPFPYGQFGENFTVEGLTEDRVCIGDIYRVGGVRIEVTQPRLPCYKLTHKMGIRGFEKQFLQSLRVGFYARVIQASEVGAGDEIEQIKQGEEALTIREITHLMMFDKANLPQVERALRIPALSAAWRRSFERQA